MGQSIAEAGILAAKAVGKYRHPAFDGLTEKALNAVYSAGRIATVANGDCLFREGDAERHWCLVLSGSGELLARVGAELVPVLKVERGECLPARLCMADGRSTATLVALDGLAVFVVADAALAALDAHTQLTLYRNIERLTDGIAGAMLARVGQLQKRMLGMSASLEAWLEDRNTLYRESAAIAGLLQKMPRLPPYAGKLTGMLVSDTASTRAVVEVAKTDPSLMASVLKTVNSAYYGLQHKIVDFQHALVLLGFNQIYQIIMNKGVQSTMPKTPEFQQLQFHSAMISVLAFEISHAVKQGSPPLLSTIGLLHDIGKSVILLLKRQHANMAFLINLLDPGMLGTLLLQEWQIPAEVGSVLEFAGHAELAPPEAVPTPHRVNVAILFVAHQCFDCMMSREGETPHTHAFFADYLKVLGQDFAAVPEFVQTCLAPAIAARGGAQPKAIQEFLSRMNRFSRT